MYKGSSNIAMSKSHNGTLNLQRLVLLSRLLHHYSKVLSDQPQRHPKETWLGTANKPHHHRKLMTQYRVTDKSICIRCVGSLVSIIIELLLSIKKGICNIIKSRYASLHIWQAAMRVQESEGGSRGEWEREATKKKHSGQSFLAVWWQLQCFFVISICFSAPQAWRNNSLQIAYVITFWQTSQSDLTFIVSHLLSTISFPSLFLPLLSDPLRWILQNPLTPISKCLQGWSAPLKKPLYPIYKTYT